MVDKKTKKYITIFNLLLVGVFLLTAGFGCKITSNEVKDHLKPITLEYWRVWDDNDAFEEVISAYRAIHPNITIKYRKFRYEEYEKELIEALAEDRGPDIFSIHESWVTGYIPKIEPMPASITMAYQKVTGTIKKEVVSDLRKVKTPSLRDIKNRFVDTVYSDTVIDEQVYGLPLSMDTLIMLYNRDLLNRSGVSQPPTSWLDFQKATQSITKFNSNGDILQSGTALGTARNIERNFDIVSVLMMQGGARMTDNYSLKMFDEIEKGYNPGLTAINFYLDFANPIKNVYSWNDDMNNSLENFMAGKVGMIFGYNYHLPTIKAKAPRLNMAIAPIPQINPGNPVNYSNYWLESVSKRSKHTPEAWDFIIFITKAEQAKKYLAITNRPTALKSLIDEQKENDELYVSADQLLTAKNWYLGNDSSVAEESFNVLIEQLPDAVLGQDFKTAIQTATGKIYQTMTR